MKVLIFCVSVFDWTFLREITESSEEIMIKFLFSLFYWTSSLLMSFISCPVAYSFWHFFISHSFPLTSCCYFSYTSTKQFWNSMKFYEFLILVSISESTSWFLLERSFRSANFDLSWRYLNILLLYLSMNSEVFFLIVEFQWFFIELSVLPWRFFDI